MSGKSRRSRAKRLSQSRRKKVRFGASPMAAQQPADTQTYEPITPPQVVAPSASVPTSIPALEPAPTAVRYPFIATELRRIGILAGIALVILIVLSLVLS